MKALQDLMEMVSQASDFDPDIVIDHLRREDSPASHVMADLIEGMNDRIKELEEVIKRKNRAALRGGSLRLNPRKRK